MFRAQYFTIVLKLNLSLTNSCEPSRPFQTFYLFEAPLNPQVFLTLRNRTGSTKISVLEEFHLDLHNNLIFIKFPSLRGVFIVRNVWKKSNYLPFMIMKYYFHTKSIDRDLFSVLEEEFQNCIIFSRTFGELNFPIPEIVQFLRYFIFIVISLILLDVHRMPFFKMGSMKQTKEFNINQNKSVFSDIFIDPNYRKIWENPMA